MEKRHNPYHSPGHQFTVAICEECGEAYEPLSKLPHECRKKNSYPLPKTKEGSINKIMAFGSFLDSITGGYVK